ncbi:NADPH:quinone reductase [Izhakiella australiensis]|uniref:NADPH:quinone reductase n=1 Tax=Izhakiella australiensis TaxID=1926881 RepID=A0A1S8YJ28_9GAMM|nr:NADP-dependent oxidoreductase [Izhakiella australiensis]OON38952.1 NADPH:quinone reductase [Izhakiella australiensis]
MRVKTMKAIRQHAFGAPEVLCYEDAPRPEIKAGEVLIEVHAAGINPPDWYLREGYNMLPAEWQPRVTFPFIPGTDVSGVIVAVADDVNGFHIGDEVYAMVRFPTGLAGESSAYAEYVNVPATEIAHKPASLDHIHAAGAPMSLLTAWQFLVDIGHSEQNPLQPAQHQPVPLAGKTVVINGAAGGVGHFAVQVAKLKGARTLAIASGRHEALLKELGADQFFDYQTTQPVEVIRDADLVLDAVGGQATARFLPTLRPGGALFPIFPLGFSAASEAEKLAVTVSATQVRSNGAQLAELGRLLETGKLRVIVDSIYPLCAARQAHQRAAQGHIQGKIVLRVR